MSSVQILYRKSIQFLLPLSIFAISIIAAFFALDISHKVVDQQSSEKFTVEANEITSAIDTRLQIYLNAMYDVRSLFAASESVERDEFQAYLNSSDIQSRFPGLTGFIFIQHVKNADKATFINSVKNDRSLIPEGYPYFSIKPEGVRSDYYVFNYTTAATSSATASTSAVFGLDALTSPPRAKAIIAAVENNTPSVTDVTMLLSTPPQKGLLVYLPVYQNGEAIETVQQRKNASQGVILAAFVANSLFEQIISEEKLNDVTVEIYDTKNSNNTTEENSIYKNAREIQKDDQQIVRTYSFADKQWTTVFYANEHYGLSNFETNFPEILFYAIIGLGFMLSLILYILTTSREKALTYVDKATATLKEDQAKLQEANKLLHEQSKQLEDKVYDLEHLNKIMVDRELKMIELKEKIKASEKKK